MRQAWIRCIGCIVVLALAVLSFAWCRVPVSPQRPDYVTDLVRQLTPAGITVRWKRPAIAPDPPATRVEYQVTQLDYPKAWLKQEIAVPGGNYIQCMNGTGWVLATYNKNSNGTLIGYSLYRVESDTLHKVIDIGRSNTSGLHDYDPFGDQAFALSDRYCVWGSIMKAANGRKTVALWAYDLLTGKSFQWGDSKDLPRPTGNDEDDSFSTILLAEDGTATTVIATGGWNGTGLEVLVQCKLPTERARVVTTAQDVDWSPLMQDGNGLWIEQRTKAVYRPQGNLNGSISLIRVDLSSGKLQTFITDSPLAASNMDGKHILLIHEGSMVSMTDQPWESPIDSSYADLWLFTPSEHTLHVVARVPWDYDLCGPCSAMLLTSGIVYSAEGPQHLFFSFREHKFYNIDSPVLPAFNGATRFGIFKYGLDYYGEKHEPSEPTNVTTVQILEPN